MMLDLVFLLIFLSHHGAAFFQNDSIVDHHRMELINYNRDYIENPKLAAIPLNRTIRAVNGSFDLMKDLNGEIIFTMEAFKMASNEYRLFPFQFAFDFCKVENENTFGISDIKNFSNLACPFKKGHYYLKKYRPDETKFPPHLVPGEYKLVINVTQRSDMLSEAHWYGTIKSTKKLRFI